MSKESYIIPQELVIWLNGKTMEERISESEKGKLAICVRCDKLFFDKESEEERQLVECNPPTPSARHECVEYANYIVLRHGFRNILDAVYYFDGDESAVEVIRYFVNKRRK